MLKHIEKRKNEPMKDYRACIQATAVQNFEIFYIDYTEKRHLYINRQ